MSFVASVVLVVLSLAANRLASRYAERVAPSVPSLPDVLHVLLPDWSAYERYIDVCPLLAAALAATELDWPELELLLDTYTVVFLWRAIFMSVTVLPSPPVCDRGQYESVGGRNDCIFSGHTAATLLPLYALSDAHPDWAPIASAASVAASAFMIATRSHYTVDVLVAWFVACVSMQMCRE